MTRYWWVAARKAEGVPTTLCCGVAGVSRQGFYDWRCAEAAGSTDRERAEAALLVNRRRYPDRATARRSIFEWLARYNTTRRHTTLACLTPDQYEAHYRHTAGTTPALST